MAITYIAAKMSATMAARRATRLASANVAIGTKSNDRVLGLLVAPVAVRGWSSIGMLLPHPPSPVEDTVGRMRQQGPEVAACGRRSPCPFARQLISPTHVEGADAAVRHGRPDQDAG